MNGNTHHLVGGFKRGAGPGFLTPVFQSRDSNHVSIQRYANLDRIRGFTPIDDGGYTRIEYFNLGLARRIGVSAFFAFRRANGDLCVSTRGRLRRTLIAEFDVLGERPFLMRAVARFLRDEDRFRYAEQQVAKRLESVPRERLHARQLSDIELERTFVRRKEYSLLRDSVVSGVHTVLAGRRGVGKTMMLRHLFIELESERGKQIWLDASAPDISLRILKEFLTQLDIEPRRTGARTRVFIDDLDAIASSYSDIIGAMRTASSRYVFVVGLSHFPDGGNTIALAGQDFRLIELSPLSSSEVGELISRRFQSDLNGLDNPERLQAEKLLADFTFREVLEIFESISRSRGSFGAEIGDAISRKFDSTLDRAFGSLVEQSQLLAKTGVIELLDKIAFGRSSISRQSDLFDDDGSRFRLVDGSYPLKAEAFLVSSGLLIRSDNGHLNFAHRLMREWWVEKRAEAVRKLSSDSIE
jgi:hypothetical protein